MYSVAMQVICEYLCTGISNRAMNTLDYIQVGLIYRILALVYLEAKYMLVDKYK